MTETLSASDLRGTMSHALFDESLEKAGATLSPSEIRRAREVLVDGLSVYALSKKEGISKQYLGREIKATYSALTADYQRIVVHVPGDEVGAFKERYRDWIPE